MVEEDSFKGNNKDKEIVIVKVWNTMKWLLVANMNVNAIYHKELKIKEQQW